jgi:hypothetical protein
VPDPFLSLVATLDPVQGARLLWDCAMLELANAQDCSLPTCGHPMAFHDGRRRCHACRRDRGPVIEDQLYWDMEEAKWNRER